MELGITGRHVGDRYNTDANIVTMKAYTVADVYAFVDIPKTVFNAVDQARLAFRVRNITDKRYAIWGDPVLSRPDPAGRAADLRDLGRVQMVGR